MSELELAVGRSPELIAAGRDPRSVLVTEWVQDQIASRAAAFVPLAFGRLQLEGRDVVLSPTYRILDEGGESGSLPLWEEPAYTMARALAADWRRGRVHEFAAVARTSAEVVASRSGTTRCPEPRLRGIQPPVEVPAPASPEMYGAFCRALNAKKPGWVVADRRVARGDDAVTVRLAETPSGVDVWFVPSCLDRAVVQSEHLWDHVVASGDTPEKRARYAAQLWCETTGAALLELCFSMRGEYGGHFLVGDPGGLPGWHVIHGGVTALNDDEPCDRAARWLAGQPVLAALADALDGSLDEQTCPHGIKIFLGGTHTEVRLNGEHHDAASQALAALDWPRTAPPGYARTFVLVLHKDHERRGRRQDN